MTDLAISHTTVNADITEDMSSDALFSGLVQVINDCLAFFTTQQLDIFLNDILDYIFTTDAELCSDGEAATPEFLTNHPEATWVVSEIRNTLQLMMIPLLSDRANLFQRRSVMVDHIRNRIIIRLYERLNCLTCGLSSDFITSLSGTVYEGNGTNGETIALLPSLDWLKDNDSVVFDPISRISLETTNVRAVRKLLNMGGKCALAVYKDAEDGIFYTAGIISYELSNKLPRFHFPRRHEWVFCVPNKVENNSSEIVEESKKETDDELKEASRACSRLRYCNGTLMLPILNLKREYQKILNNMGFEDTTVTNILNIIKATDKCKHGAVLILSDPDTIHYEINRLVSAGNRGIAFESPVAIFDEHGSSPSFERFASIDGAVLADLHGKCRACGVILDGENQNKGAPSRGSRYNSVKTYVEWKKTCNPSIQILGIVKSEDGMLNMFNGDAGKIC